MVVGLGCDLTEVSRIEKALHRQPDFASTVLSAEELIVFNRRNELSQARGLKYLASRWAAKEAFSKAYGTGFRGPVKFADISVLNNDVGAPYLKFSGELLQEIQKKELVFNISLSDTDLSAMAVVICERKE